MPPFTTPSPATDSVQQVRRKPQGRARNPKGRARNHGIASWAHGSDDQPRADDIETSIPEPAATASRPRNRRGWLGACSWSARRSARAWRSPEQSRTTSTAVRPQPARPSTTTPRVASRQRSVPITEASSRASISRAATDGAAAAFLVVQVNRAARGRTRTCTAAIRRRARGYGVFWLYLLAVAPDWFWYLLFRSGCP